MTFGEIAAPWAFGFESTDREGGRRRARRNCDESKSRTDGL